MVHSYWTLPNLKKVIFIGDFPQRMRGQPSLRKKVENIDKRNIANLEESVNDDNIMKKNRGS